MTYVKESILTSENSNLPFLLCAFYQHFKGGLYYVRGLATDTETGNQMVVYQSVDGQNQGKMWVREYSYFRSPVTRDGETYVRFRLITDMEETEKLEKQLLKSLPFDEDDKK